MRRIRPSHTSVVFATIVLVGVTAEASGQMGGLGGLADRLRRKAPSATSILGDTPPITTSLSDAKWEDPSVTGPNERIRSLLQLQRTPNAGFVLQPGYWSMQAQSYCLQAGTYGPGGGEGYLYAPTLGPASDQVISIVRNSVNHPEIKQQQIQSLLWAIIARAKFEDLSPELKATASRLLTPKQLSTLNNSAFDKVSGTVLEKGMPDALRQVLQAEAKLREMLTTPGTSYSDYESVAVLSGVLPVGLNSREVPSGRWSRHPDGYYVRYLPEGYQTTVVEIWVPQGSRAVGKEYDPATHIAVPGNTAQQRLIQSGRQQAADSSEETHEETPRG